MSDTNISWANKVWNPIVGCSKVSAGCKNCYAEAMGRRLRAMALAKIEKGEEPGRLRAYMDAVDERGHWTGEVVTLPEVLGEPLKWRKPARVFVNSMSDLFHPGVPFEFVAAVFGVMAACPQHTFLVLTKRPERAREFFRWVVEQDRPTGRLANDRAPRDSEGTPGRLECCWQALAHEARRTDAGPLHTKHAADPLGLWPLPNVHLGVSVEDQPTADERIPLLLQCPAAVRWVSYEPALGPIDFSPWLPDAPGADPLVEVAGRMVDPRSLDSVVSALTGVPVEATGIVGRKLVLDWVIVGGESGPNARPFDVAWARSVVRQCREAGVPAYVKQMGAQPWFHSGGGFVNDPLRFKDKAGADPSEWPADLRVREFPR